MAPDSIPRPMRMRPARYLAAFLMGLSLALAGCVQEEPAPDAPPSGDGGTTPPPPTGTDDGTDDGTDVPDGTDDGTDGDDGTTPPPGPRRVVAELHALEANGTVGATLGWIVLTDDESGFRIDAFVAGLTGEHGFHVHENGDCGPTTSDAGAVVPGGAAGGHFNPTGAAHGEHAGDLPNLVANAHGLARASLAGDDLAANLTLGEGNGSVLGRSIVIHRDADDGTSQPAGNAGPRVACAVVPDDFEPTAVGYVGLAPTTDQGVAEDATGWVLFTEDAFGLLVHAVVTGLTGEHGFHVHQNASCAATTGADGTVTRAGAAGGHYDPRGAEHGEHAGDLPNLVAGEDGVARMTDEPADLTGPLSLRADADATLVGRSVVVHRDADDFVSQPAGNSGPRILCGAVQVL